MRHGMYRAEANLLYKIERLSWPTILQLIAKWHFGS